MSAVVEVAGLLRAGESVNVDGDYLDVLREHDAIGPHPGQQVFRKKTVPRIYERLWRPIVARAFYGLSGPGAAKEQRMVMEMLQVREGDQVIDVGCGPGNYTRRLARAAGDGLTVGLDASAAMVAAAAKRGGGENLAFLRGDASALPFEDELFDIVCSIGVIHLVEEPLVALGEMARVLAPGGRLAVMALCERRDRQPRKRAGMTIFARDELAGALREHGLDEIEQQVFGRGQFISAHKPPRPVPNGG
jgi:ubiquinone/menaquinone biosynthesis C-methylase UbiE